MNYFRNINNKNILGNERPMDFFSDVEYRYNLMKQYIKGKNVLDIGCGLGFGANFLASNGARSVIGIDRSSSAIKRARENFKLSNLEFIVMDVLDLSKIKSRFDVISAFEIIEHLNHDNHIVFLKNVMKKLKKNGIFVLSTPNKKITSYNKNKPLNPYHKIEYSYIELKNLISDVFENFEIFGLVNSNKDYDKYLEKTRNSLRKRFLNFIFQFKFVHTISNFLPRKLKNRVSKQDSFELKASDFKITSKNVLNCENFIVIVKN